MPYYITQENSDCSGWAVVDAAGEAFGCHTTKKDAIAQAVAISLSDNEPYMGERSVRAVDLSAPQYMRDAASQGLKYYEDGLGGDGLTARTVREARDMASGTVSENKWVRIAAWIARHMDDLDAPNADPNAEGYPSAGVVAHLLWGSGPSKSDAERAMKFAEGKVMEIQSESRDLNGDVAVICDIDGTLISNGELNDKVYEFVSSMDALLFIVTGRPESQRDDTVAELDALGVSYDKLEMNDGSTADSPEYKKGVAEKLLETYNVILAVENDEQTRANYEALGIDAVNPSEIDSIDSEGAGDVQPMDGEDEPRSRREFLTRTNAAGFEIRETQDGMRFSGYAAVFNSPSEPLPFTERIAPGAFKRSLRSRNDIKLLWGHDSNAILGSTRAKTLTLVEDDKGLRVEALLPNTNLGRDAAELLRRGDVDAMSFGFNVIKDSWSKDGSERTLHSVRLYEVSIVGWPAYSATAGTATVRSFDKLVARTAVDAKEFEAALIKLENGETLDESSRNLLEGVIESLSGEKTFAPDQQDSVFNDMAMLELKKKKLELLKNGFNPLS